jgi:hypothetical protein
MSQDWVGIYKGRDKEKCHICGGTIFPDSYVGIMPDGSLFCRKCLLDAVIKRQEQEGKKESADINNSGLYI